MHGHPQGKTENREVSGSDDKSPHIKIVLQLAHAPGSSDLSFVLELCSFLNK